MEKGRTPEEVKWLGEWRTTHKKEVNAIIKKLQHKGEEITDEMINDEILEPSLYKGMADYGGTGNPSTTNIIQLDHLYNWEHFLAIVQRDSRQNRVEMLRKLNKVLKKLPKRERLLLEMRYGMGEYNSIKLREIADTLHITTTETNNRINRILKKAQKIAKKMGLT